MINPCTVFVRLRCRFWNKPRDYQAYCVVTTMSVSFQAMFYYYWLFLNGQLFCHEKQQQNNLSKLAVVNLYTTVSMDSQKKCFCWLRQLVIQRLWVNLIAPECHKQQGFIFICHVYNSLILLFHSLWIGINLICSIITLENEKPKVNYCPWREL